MTPSLPCASSEPGTRQREVRMRPLLLRNVGEEGVGLSPRRLLVCMELVPLPGMPRALYRACHSRERRRVPAALSHTCLVPVPLQ